MPKLMILTGLRAGESVEISKPEFSIGRDASCDLAIQDGTISRRHTLLVQAGGGWEVRDLDSRNGIRVAGKKVSAGPIASGEILHVGSVQMRFLAEAVARPDAPAGTPHKPWVDLPTVLLGLMILTAVGLLVFQQWEKAPEATHEVVSLREDQEVYYPLDAKIVSIERPSLDDVVEVDAREGQGSLLLRGMSEGEADLMLLTEEGPLVLHVRVGPRAKRRSSGALAPEEAARRLEQLESEADLAAKEEVLALVALQKYEEALRCSAFAAAPEAAVDLQQKRDAAKRRVRALREKHEDLWLLYAKQKNRKRYQEEALQVLNLIDPDQDAASHQKWAGRLVKSGIPASEIPLRLQRLRGGL